MKYAPPLKTDPHEVLKEQLDGIVSQDKSNSLKNVFVKKQETALIIMHAI